MIFRRVSAKLSAGSVGHVIADALKLEQQPINGQGLLLYVRKWLHHNLALRIAVPAVFMNEEGESWAGLGYRGCLPWRG
jgi:hypothetical protein